MSVTIELEPTTNFADFDPIFPDFRDFTGDGVFYRIYRNVASFTYGILTTFQAMTTLGTMATKIFVLDSQNSRPIGYCRKLKLEDTKTIIYCLNCAEMLAPLY